MPKVYVIQKPRSESDFESAPLEALGEIEYLLPGAPNIHDQDRMTADLLHMKRIIDGAAAADVFVVLGGSPLSQMLFGAAYVLAGRRSINYGLYSRGRDGDGRRGGKTGSYRIVPIDLGCDDEPVNELQFT